MRAFIKTLIIGLVCILATGMQACEDSPEQKPTAVNKTLLMFMPWTGDLTEYLSKNIDDMESVIARNGLYSERVLVYFATSESEATLFEIIPSKGSTSRHLLKKYSTGNRPDITTPAGLASMLAEVKSLSPSSHYALAVGCHGYGWLPKSAFASKGKQQRLLTVSAGDDAGFPTRFFGGTQTDWQIDITDFAEGIKMSGLHFDYILFDDCYMASIEAIYDLRHLTDYVVASPCEMMAAGLPYANIGQHLLGTPDLKALCDGFYDFYSSYRMPYGTLSVVDCREMDNLAALMKRINASHAIDDSEIPSIQRLDYFRPAVFVDLGDYAERLIGNDAVLLDEFKKQLSKTVVYEVHTPYYYTNSAGRIKLDRCCGVSVSDPSTHSFASAKTATSWWIDTH